MGLSSIDRKIALNYAHKVLKPVSFGESGIFFWFPGSGMTTILHDIFQTKEVIKETIVGLSSRIVISQFWGNVAMKNSLEGLFESSNFGEYKMLENYANEVLKKGNELVCVIGRIDNFPEVEKIKILKTFVKLNSINRRRIHIILNLVDKPWLENTIVRYPEITSIANSMEIMPLLNGSLLTNFIKQRSLEFGSKLSKGEMKDIVENYGGLLSLIKEHLRSGKSGSSLQHLKLKVLWKDVPNSYKDAFENIFFDSKKEIQKFQTNDLEAFGVLGVQVIKNLWFMLNEDSKSLLNKMLSDTENTLLEHLDKHKGKVLTKDEVINILWPENIGDISFWAVDQAISRFRKKLIRVGIDPDRLRTVKGKGYVWQ